MIRFFQSWLIDYIAQYFCPVYTWLEGYFSNYDLRWSLFPQFKARVIGFFEPFFFRLDLGCRNFFTQAISKAARFFTVMNQVAGFFSSHKSKWGFLLSWIFVASSDYERECWFDKSVLGVQVFFLFKNCLQLSLMLSKLHCVF